MASIRNYALIYVALILLAATGSSSSSLPEIFTYELAVGGTMILAVIRYPDRRLLPAPERRAGRSTYLMLTALFIVLLLTLAAGTRSSNATTHGRRLKPNHAFSLRCSR